MGKGYHTFLCLLRYGSDICLLLSLESVQASMVMTAIWHGQGPGDMDFLSGSAQPAASDCQVSSAGNTSTIIQMWATL